MNTAGLNLDFYDDLGGELLKKNFPTSESLPEVIKTAHILSNEEQSILRDDAFALILVNDGKALRKFACVDAGNTLLSALYFEENKDKLPEEAVKVAMANILSACEEFGLPIRDLEKIAGKKENPSGAIRKRDPMKQPVAGDEADWMSRTNMSSVQGTGNVLQATQMKTAAGNAEQSVIRQAWEGAKKGWKDGSKAHDEADAKGSKAREAFRKKNGNDKPDEEDAAYWDAHGKKDINLDSFHKLNPEAKPKKKVANIVDVSALSPPILVKKASAKHLALDRYPLDSFNDVEAAVRYFSEFKTDMSPVDRHEFAVKTASRATELGIALTDELERYGSTEYAPDIEGHLASRRAIAPEHAEIWNALQEKRASISPDVFVSLLEQADLEAGVNWFYGADISDPYFSTFGGNAVKEANAAWNWQSRVGDYVSADQLQKLARNGRPLVEKQFDSGLALAFARDPITIFESLPDVQKTILARLASQEFDGLPTN